MALGDLFFEPANDPVPRKPDGGLDRTQVTVIRILEVGIIMTNTSQNEI